MTNSAKKLIAQRFAGDDEKRKRMETYSAASLKSGFSGIEAAG
jgi:hypothetical protein